MCTVSSKG